MTEAPRRIAKALAPDDPIRHTPIEDAVAFAIAITLLGFGILLLQQAGLATGGVAGVALVLHVATGWPSGLLFVAVNLPFYLLIFRVLGREFGVKTLIVNALLAGFLAVAPHGVTLSVRNEAFAAVTGGLLLGMGVLALARHKASVGGTSALALYLQEKRILKAGVAQALTDCVILLGAALVLDARHVALSILSALVLSLVLALNHKPGRYAGH